MNVALNLPQSAEVVLTEQCSGGAMEHLLSNVERAAVDGARVSAVGCDWAHYSDRPVAEETGCFQPAEGTSAWTGEVGKPPNPELTIPTNAVNFACDGRALGPPYLSPH